MNTLTFAYFSMEIGISSAMPTYAGGLGILAGDTIRAAADLGIPAAGVTLLHRKGYFRQKLDSLGNQQESDAFWSPEEYLEILPVRVQINLFGRPVQIQAWRCDVKGEFGSSIPVFFLDTALPQNTPWDQKITDHLYLGDRRYRLAQEAVLGFGGVAMLRALGYLKIKAFHMNEGHSAFVGPALMEEHLWGQHLASVTSEDIASVSRHCVFTTHTPLPAGHEEFGLDLVEEVLGKERAEFLARTRCVNGTLNMTSLALNFSRYVNGVSMRHEEITRRMFSDYQIDAITNGVHAVSWTSPAFCEVYDRFIPQWRKDNLYLKYAIRIPLDEIKQTHQKAKRALVAEVKERTSVELDPNVFTIGFARRATQYKRHSLLFTDIERLRNMALNGLPIQIIYGGKAHPYDEDGKALIRRVFEAARSLEGSIRVVYLEEYNATIAKYLCSGVDLWLNTPQKPWEASGTSGMKAALNGVPTFSTLDGWWVEGHIEGVTGWSISESWKGEANLEQEVSTLYEKLEKVILPMYYHRPDDYANVMRSAIAINGSYFNAQRMVNQYLQNAYNSNGNGCLNSE